MTHRFALLAATAITLAATPALAQDGGSYDDGRYDDGRYDDGRYDDGTSYDDGGYYDDGAPADGAYYDDADRYAAYGDPAYGDPAYDGAESGDYRGAWDGEWVDGQTWRGNWSGTFTDVDGNTIDADYAGTWIDDTRFLADDGHLIYRDGDRGWQEDAYSSADGRPLIRRDMRRRGGGRRNAGPPPVTGPRLAYTQAQRDEWLAQCRELRGETRGGHYVAYDDYDDGYYYDDGYSGPGIVSDERRDANLAGGVAGAIAGGYAGNRIAGRGDRLAGTLIGAGVGGLLGTVIGGVIDSLGDRDRRDDVPEPVYVEDEPGFGYCEAYLLNYERGYPLPAQTIAYAPVVLAPVTAQVAAPQIQRAIPARRRVIEERVVVEQAPPAPAPQPTRRRAVQHTQPAPTKLVPVK